MIWIISSESTWSFCSSERQIFWWLIVRNRVWPPCCSCLNNFMSNWGIMTCTFSLNSSINYRYWFWNMDETFLLSSDSLRDFFLRSFNDIVNFPSNRVNFRFSIKISSHVVICFNKLFKLFLEAIVLMI
jgi:hypothetical protein